MMGQPGSEGGEGDVHLGDGVEVVEEHEDSQGVEAADADLLEDRRIFRGILVRHFYEPPNTPTLCPADWSLTGRILYSNHSKTICRKAIFSFALLLMNGFSKN
jgi:hypothetical protein